MHAISPASMSVLLFPRFYLPIYFARPSRASVSRFYLHHYMFKLSVLRRAIPSVAAATLICGINLSASTLAHASDVIVLDSGEADLTLIDEATHKVVATEPTGK